MPQTILQRILLTLDRGSHGSIYGGRRRQRSPVDNYVLVGLGEVRKRIGWLSGKPG